MPQVPAEFIDGTNWELVDGSDFELLFSPVTIGGSAAMTLTGTTSTIRYGSLPPPDNVEVTRSTDRESATVTWDAVAGAEDYQVYRAPDYRAQPAVVGTVNAPTLTLNDTGLDETVNYTYSVRARNTTHSVNGRRSRPVYTPKENDVINE